MPHARVVIDRKTVFVGSYNLDPRSAWINCEQGVLVESEVLAQEAAAIFARQITGQRAWHVTLARGDLSWSDGTETFSSDPHSSIGQQHSSRRCQHGGLHPVAAIAGGIAIGGGIGAGGK